jgi:hypothetical protein
LSTKVIQGIFREEPGHYWFRIPEGYFLAGILENYMVCQNKQVDFLRGRDWGERGEVQPG